MLCEMKGNPELIPDYIPVPQYPQGPPIRIIKNEKKDGQSGKLYAALADHGPEMLRDMALVFTAIRRKLKPERIRWKSKKDHSAAFRAYLSQI